MKDFLDAAAAEAWKGARRGDGGPFGAVILKGNKIVAQAHNTVLKSKDATCHAEVNAIRLASKKLKNPFLRACVIYSTTEPCPMCFSAIHWAKIRKVVYSTTISDVKKLGFNELKVSNRLLKKWGKSPVQIKKISNPACRELLRRWKALPKRRIY